MNAAHLISMGLTPEDIRNQLIGSLDDYEISLVILAAEAWLRSDMN